jgi:NADH-quinone oxidoreductase subunit N
VSEKLALILPEIALFITTCIVMVVGLSPSQRVRRLCAWITGAGLIVAGALAGSSPATGGLFPEIMPYAKLTIALVGVLLLLPMSGVVDRDLERLIEQGKTKFNALTATRAEFYAFYLFSLTGLMLVASADDLIWLFLALELTSLPTYIMVTISTRRTQSQEAGIKYFFLGALGAAIFLYGFALLYGAAGTTNLTEIAAHFAEARNREAPSALAGAGTIGMAGLLISILGVAFKIAAVPMHFYTPDVYQGAASPVSAFLAFVPKTAGFLSLFLLCGLVGWSHGVDANALPQPVAILLWVMAALTMTVGNVLAVLQDSVKRMLAYSSIAHSGYMLVGVIAGPGGSFTTSGLAAVLFYLACYGVMNVGVFAVLSALERADGSEPDSFEELRGLVKRHPLLGWSVVLCTLSLLGFPPLLGFVGKLGLFTSGVSAGLMPLVLVLGINSAIAAFYYLRLVTTVYLEDESPVAKAPRPAAVPGRVLAAALSAAGVLALLATAQPMVNAAWEASGYARDRQSLPQAASAGVSPIPPSAIPDVEPADAG